MDGLARLLCEYDPDWFDKLPENLQRELIRKGQGPYDPHPEIPGAVQGNGNMTEEEFVAWSTDPAVARHQGYSETEIQRLQEDSKARKAAEEIEASANHSGDAGRGRQKRALDYLVQDFLRAHHAGYRLQRPLWTHKAAPGLPFSDMPKRWGSPECYLVKEICAAVLRGDFKFLRKLYEVVREMQPRLSGEADSFDVKPFRKGTKAVLDAKTKTGNFPVSVSDIKKHIMASTGVDMSEGHIANLKRKLGFKPARPGRKRKIKP